ncbi:MAG TPA: S24 family peptidase, partial [Dongiaceae bacterium]|nr:S24 family peptidase [Dongiaceae bacterium]
MSGKIGHGPRMRYKYRIVNGKITAPLAMADAGTIPHMAKRQSLSSSDLAKRIDSRLQRLGISARAASLKAGLDADTIRNIQRGKSLSPRGASLNKLARVLECPVEYLLGHDGDLGMQHTPDLPVVTYAPPGYAAVPFIAARASMGGGHFVEDELLGPPKYYEESIIAGELRARPQDLRALEVEGQSMEPLLHSRDQVLIDTRKRNVIEPGIFVLFDGEGVVCKWVQRLPGKDPAKLRIKSENTRFEPYDVLAD